MIANARYERILEKLNDRNLVLAKDLQNELNISESTLRRDLIELEKAGELKRVHGGAIRTKSPYFYGEDEIEQRRERNIEQKTLIGKKAASLINPNDVVYIDAGTTTEQLAEAVTEPGALYVTNAFRQAKVLSAKGFQVLVLAGKFKAVTEALIGTEANLYLERYNFTKGFFGTNYIDDVGRLTTADIEEASTKTKAMERCRECYILADSSKFNKQGPITFGSVQNNHLITDAFNDQLEDMDIDWIIPKKEEDE